MVAVDKVQEPLKQLGALLLGQAIDVLDVSANGEDALPPGDGVRSDDWVDGLELGADVLGCAARLVIELEAGSLCNLAETGLLEGCGQGLEELLVRRADSVVDLVARGPERV